MALRPRPPAELLRAAFAGWLGQVQVVKRWRQRIHVMAAIDGPCEAEDSQEHAPAADGTCPAQWPVRSAYRTPSQGRSRSRSASCETSLPARHLAGASTGTSEVVNSAASPPQPLRCRQRSRESLSFSPGPSLPEEEVVAGDTEGYRARSALRGRRRSRSPGRSVSFSPAPEVVEFGIAADARRGRRRSRDDSRDRKSDLASSTTGPNMEEGAENGSKGNPSDQHSASDTPGAVDVASSPDVGAAPDARSSSAEASLAVARERVVEVAALPLGAASGGGGSGSSVASSAASSRPEAAAAKAASSRHEIVVAKLPTEDREASDSDTSTGDDSEGAPGRLVTASPSAASAAGSFDWFDTLSSWLQPTDYWDQPRGPVDKPTPPLLRDPSPASAFPPAAAAPLPSKRKGSEVARASWLPELTFWSQPLEAATAAAAPPSRFAEPGLFGAPWGCSQVFTTKAATATKGTDRASSAKGQSSPQSRARGSAPKSDDQFAFFGSAWHHPWAAAAAPARAPVSRLGYWDQPRGGG